MSEAFNDFSVCAGEEGVRAVDEINFSGIETYFFCFTTSGTDSINSSTVSNPIFLKGSFSPTKSAYSSIIQTNKITKMS